MTSTTQEDCDRCLLGRGPPPFPRRIKRVSVFLANPAPSLPWAWIFPGINPATATAAVALTKFLLEIIGSSFFIACSFRNSKYQSRDTAGY